MSYFRPIAERLERPSPRSRVDLIISVNSQREKVAGNGRVLTGLVAQNTQVWPRKAAPAGHNPVEIFSSVDGLIRNDGF